MSNERHTSFVRSVKNNGTVKNCDCCESKLSAREVYYMVGKDWGTNSNICRKCIAKIVRYVMVGVIERISIDNI